MLVEADALASGRSLWLHSSMDETTVNFVAFDDDQSTCLLVLVEEGWSGEVDTHLTLLQDRLYGCLEAALDGQVAAVFPESRGMDFIIRVDCYDLPADTIDTFVHRFAAGIFEMNDFSPETSEFVRSFRFEVNPDTLPT